MGALYRFFLLDMKLFFPIGIVFQMLLLPSLLHLARQFWLDVLVVHYTIHLSSLPIILLNTAVALRASSTYLYILHLLFLTLRANSWLLYPQLLLNHHIIAFFQTSEVT